jgi:hypothetical protein
MKMFMKDLSQRCFAVFRWSVLIVTAASLSASISYANPPSCADIFIDGLQSNRNGYVRFGYNARLIDSPTSVLYVRDALINPWSQTKSCGNQHCIALGSSGPRLYGPPFKTTTATATANVPPHNKLTLGETAYEFGNVNIEEWGTGEFSSVHTEYVIDTLTMSYKSTLRLPAGTYWIKKLNLEVDGKIDVLGDGSVIFFVMESFTLPLNFKINAGSKNPAKFGIYAYDNVDFYVDSRTYAFVHIERLAKLHYKSAVVGSVVAHETELLTESQVRYDPTAAQALNFGSMCRPL